MKKFLLLFFPCILLLGGCGQEKDISSELVSHISKTGSVNFAISLDELREINECPQSPAELINEAFNGNRAALYIAGIRFINGTFGMARQPEYGKSLIAKSASLGFVPALVDIGYRTHQFNALTYLNLAISQGHSELIPVFNKIKTQIIEELDNKLEKIFEEYPELFSDYQKNPLKFMNTLIWQPLEKEIIRITQHKQSLIFLNQKNLKKHNDPDNKFIFNILPITDEDILFNPSFYASAMHNKNPHNLESWIEENRKAIEEANALQQSYNLILTFNAMKDFGIKYKSTVK